MAKQERNGEVAWADRTAGAHSWHAKFGLETTPLPIDPYISRDYFEQERERIFKTAWLNIGHVERIPHAGDYFVKDLAACHTSVIVVRGHDGQVRAFHNMCSHRGNKIAWDTHGSCQNFTCKFHGWSYGVDGRLKFIPDEANFFDVQKDTLGLTPVAVDIWEGFIFVNVDPSPQESLQEFLGEMWTSVQGYPFSEVSATRFSWQSEVRANWKVVKDAFQEFYHIAFLHRKTIGDVFCSPSNPYAHGIDFDLFSRHARTSMYGNPDHTPTRVEALARRFGSMLMKHDFSPEKMPQGVNAAGDPNWTIEGSILFPNSLVFVSEGTYLIHTVWPLAEDRTLWEAQTFFPKAHTTGQRFSQEYSKVLFRDLLMEDGNTLEKTQSMLASGAKKEITIQDQEVLIRHHHKVAGDYLGT